MKRFDLASSCLALVIVLALSAPRAVAAESHLYGQTIVKPAKTGELLTSAVKDAADTLAKVTGKPFSITDQDAPQAIVLKLDAPTTAPATSAASFDIPSEAFTIRSTAGADQLVISSQCEGGLVHGLYFYLEQIGVRWFFPGDNWTIIPSKQDITLNIDRTVKPAIISRGAFGTGGYGPKNPVDPKLDVKTRWETWRLRNGYGGPFRIQGHTGEAFNTQHRKELEAHPEYFAMINGKRQPWSLGTKLCVSNPDAVKMYVDDRLAFFKKNPTVTILSVEPGDGAGYCECPECSKIGVNDQPFYLANQVAKAVAKEFPGKWVSILAYATHADVPKFDLEPNVYVLVVPYGFQRTNLPGDQLLEAWSKKVKHFGVYDYWSIPDWTRDKPDFNWTTRPAKQIKFWHDTGAETINFESTNSAGAIGITQYLAGHLMWDPDRDAKPLIDDFLKLSFGPAEPPMRRMLTRWANGFMFADHELALSYRDLDEAMRLAGDDAGIKSRVEDYARYVHYLRLLYEMRGGESPDAADSQRKLVTYLWRIDHSCMVHSYRMAMLVFNRWAPSETLRSEFDAKNPNSEGWKESIPQVTSEEVHALLADGLAKYKPLDFESRTYASELIAPPPGKVSADAPPQFGPVFATTGIARFEFEAPGNLKTFSLMIAIGRGGSDPPDAVDPVTLTDASGKQVYSTTLPVNSPSRRIDIPLPGPGRYTLEIRDAKRGLHLQLPSGFPLITRGFASTDLSPRMFFYVPKGVKKIAFFMTPAAPVTFRDSSGTSISPETHGITLLAVPDGQDGKIWSLQGFKGYTGIWSLNTPGVFSFSPQTLMYPKDLADEVAPKAQ